MTPQVSDVLVVTDSGNSAKRYELVRAEPPLLRELEANHAGNEHAQRLCDALGVWVDRQQPVEG